MPPISALLSLILFTCLFLPTFAREFGTIPSEDPYTEPPGKFNVSLPPLIEVYKGSNHSGYRITGLSKLKRTTNYDPLSMKLDFEAELPRLRLVSSPGSYHLLGWIDVTPLREETFPSGDMAGVGTSFSYNMTSMHVAGKAEFTLKSGGRPYVKELFVRVLNFDRIETDWGGNFSIEGVLVDYKRINKEFKANFFKDWAEMKEEIVEKARLTINKAIEKVRMSDLLIMFGEEDVIKTGMRFLPQSDSFFGSGHKSKKGKGGKDKGKKSGSFLDSVLPF